MRVEAPDYLMSPVRGRSNIDNAAAHRDAPTHRLIDIEDFYRGIEKVRSRFILTMAANNLARLPRLLAA